MKNMTCFSDDVCDVRESKLYDEYMESSVVWCEDTFHRRYQDLTGPDKKHKYTNTSVFVVDMCDFHHRTLMKQS